MRGVIKLFLFIFLYLISSSIAFGACGDGIAGGSGTVGDPYQINDATELASISNCLGSANSGKYFKLMNDINVGVAPYNTGSGWTPIGTSANNFYGKFDGDYKTVSNVYINGGSADYLGLFGVIGSSGIVQNIVVSSPNISGDYGVGALAGSNKGTVTKSGVIYGSVTGTQRLGGLIGEDSGGISYSFASTTVYFTPGGSATCCAGGLAGEVAFGGASSVINNSYSKSNIIITYSAYNQGSIGGVLGNDYSSGAKSNLYATGPITMVSGNLPPNVGGLSGGAYTSISNSYWDTQTSGRATSNGGAGVVGKTTTQMKDQATYSGWDFSTIWGINPSINDGYPYLLWTPDAPVDTTSPTASTTAPVGGVVVSGASVTLSSNVSDDTAVAGVKFYINGILQGSEDTSLPYSISWNSTATSSGSKTILSVARDSSNNYGTSTAVSFIVDNTVPIVSITSPVSNEATSSVMTLIANASDVDSSIIGVKFYINGILQGSEDTSLPYSISFDTTATTSSSHSVVAVARDSGGNIATSSAVSFSISNTGATPSGVMVNSTLDGGIFTWTTSSETSSRVWFGVIDNISSSTPETNTSVRVISHNVTLSGLPSCTRYHFVVSGKDLLLNSATSTDSTFTTGGCTGDSDITNTENGSVSSDLGGTVTNGVITISIPSSFSSSTNSAIFQIHELASADFFATAGIPTGKSRVGDAVFNLKALADATTTISSFDSTLTVSLSYTDEDIVGIEESSLRIYRYDGANWNSLANCSVNTNTNIVTCDTTAFSDFAIFGDVVVVSSSNTSNSSLGSGGNTVQSRVANLTAMGNITEANKLRQEWSYLFVQGLDYTSSSTVKSALISTTTQISALDLSNSTRMITKNFNGRFERDLDKEDEGEDVRMLQKFLIEQSVGPSGKELARVGSTGYFGQYTKNALGEFQKFVGIRPFAGFFGSITRSYINSRY